MTQRDRDRLVVLKKALKKLIKQSQAAKELDLSARQVRRLFAPWLAASWRGSTQSPTPAAPAPERASYGPV